MEDLRAAIENDLHDSIEGEFGVNVELITPDGETQSMSLLYPTEYLRARVQYSSTQLDPATGVPVIVANPIVTLRIASLIRVPAAGERWMIKMPISPRIGAESRLWPFGVDRSAMDGSDIGYIKIYPQRIDQESGPIPS
jgi:hypothetical protein